MLGDFTKALLLKIQTDARAAPDTFYLNIRVQGPYGGFPGFFEKFDKRVFIVGGIGVTPAISLLKALYGVHDVSKVTELLTITSGTDYLDASKVTDESTDESFSVLPLATASLNDHSRMTYPDPLQSIQNYLNVSKVTGESTDEGFGFSVLPLATASLNDHSSMTYPDPLQSIQHSPSGWVVNKVIPLRKVVLPFLPHAKLVWSCRSLDEYCLFQKVLEAIHEKSNGNFVSEVYITGAKYAPERYLFLNILIIFCDFFTLPMGTSVLVSFVLLFQKQPSAPAPRCFLFFKFFKE